MLKRSLAAGLLACAALTPVALAQSNQADQQKAQSAPSSQAGDIQFIKTLEERQFRSSDLVGQTVYNEQDENIGDIGDVLLDRQGKVLGVTIDVGGFLGIGENEVAVPMNALRFEPVEGAGMAANQPGSAATGRSSAAGSSNTQTAPQAQAGAQGEPAGTSSQAALPNQDAQSPSQGSAQQSAAEGSSAAKQDPAEGRASAANQSSGSMSGNQSAANQSSSGQAGAAGMADTDSTLNAKIVLNTNREDLENAPKFEDAANQ